MSKRNKLAECCTCQRHTALTFHHLIPRKMHRRTHFKKHYTRDQLQQGIMMCRLCHTGLHKRFSEMELAKSLSSLEALQQHEDLQGFFAWVSKQKIQH